ncbi:hypothetical protein PUNSTDRAFT_63016 [Punctularia strigosozonata HHB-11173 SS5]|uniref:uncharacterized protein n=1 Tax=Punctularia strigosozonata (strain HHB-11173) TaxID=741275 RepID=UPI00044179AF|nr:uncharacterized protein PUNSTDRAFT_63016 [Punctularia strigosozonata HHB-11173 SS5]EIN11527.1 hypothetical protein PUNSTDRAFT_63016 [Punctularia strigosozonata HHB-11173 SS5]
MQPPTCTLMHVRTPLDAHLIFHAVHEGIFPMITKRLDGMERRGLRSGHVFVWQGDDIKPRSKVGIERWTDGRSWGPSRTKDDFLFYKERESIIEASFAEDAIGLRVNTRERLIKQTYSAYVVTRDGRRKWHMIAYTSDGSLHGLKTVQDFPELRGLRVPPGKYTRARLPKGPRSRHAPSEPGPAPPPVWPPFSDPHYSPPPYHHHPNSFSYPSPHGYPAVVPIPSPPSSTESTPSPYPPSRDLPPPASWRRSPPMSAATFGLPHPLPLPLAWHEPPKNARNDHRLPPLEDDTLVQPHVRRHPLDERALMSFPLAMT